MAECCTCFNDYIVKCNEFLRVWGQLQFDTEYTWVIRDKFDNEYSNTFTTDGAGFWHIPIEQLPPGLLTEYSGQFTLTVLDLGCKPVRMKIAQEFNCIEFTVKGGTREKNNLGCEF